MYKTKYLNRPFKEYQCNGEIFKGQSIEQTITENIRTILKYIFGKEVKRYFALEMGNDIRYEVYIQSNKFEFEVNIKIIQDGMIAEEGQTKVFSSVPTESINETIIIEAEKFYGTKELAELIGMDRRKFSTYLERGKIIAPDYKLFNGPLWVKSRIEGKQILELKRGKKNEEF